MNSETFQLTVKKGPSLGKTFELAKDKVTIGRDPDMDVTFDIAEVSRSHAKIIRQGNDYFLQDLGSTNGTYVNETKITGRQPLQSGDTVMLGDAVHLLFSRQHDLGATAVSAPPFQDKMAGTKPAMPAVQKPQAQQQPPQPRAQERYAGRVPAGPAAQPYAPEEEEEQNKTWLWAGLGCLAVFIFLLVIGMVVFDYMNLYCSPPFNQLFSFLYTCP